MLEGLSLSPQGYRLPERPTARPVRTAKRSETFCKILCTDWSKGPAAEIVYFGGREEESKEPAPSLRSVKSGHHCTNHGLTLVLDKFSANGGDRFYKFPGTYIYILRSCGGTSLLAT